MKSSAESDLVKRLQEIDINETSPRQAWDLIAELKRRAEEP
jgi:hypothetical protein